MLEESLEHARLHDDVGTVTNITHGLGDAALLGGDLDAAARYYREALLLARESNALGVLSVCMAGLAAVAPRRGEDALATQLWGALERLERTSADRRIGTGDRARYEQYLPLLDPTALAKGLQLNEAEAWALALEADI